mgnify:CR=1 FL=1
MRNTKKDEGRIYDYSNNASIYFTLPAWIIEEDELKEYSPLRNLTQIIGSYFDKLQKTISMNGNGITPDSIWNMDETGFQIGVGKSKMVITRRHNKTSHLGVPTNRESATAIEAISVEGEVCPAFLILSGRLHQDGWYKIPELSEKTVIGTSDSGYLNDFISLE